MFMWQTMGRPIDIIYCIYIYIHNKNHIYIYIRAKPSISEPSATSTMLLLLLYQTRTKSPKRDPLGRARVKPPELRSPRSESLVLVVGFGSVCEGTFPDTEADARVEMCGIEMCGWLTVLCSMGVGACRDDCLVSKI